MVLLNHRLQQSKNTNIVKAGACQRPLCNLIGIRSNIHLSVGGLESFSLDTQLTKPFSGDPLVKRFFCLGAT